MLRSAIAPRRAAYAILRSNRNPISSIPNIQRQISFLSWRKKDAQPPIPVYFAKESSQSQPPAFARRMGRIAGTLIIYYMCWQVFATVVIDPLFDWAESEWTTMSDKEKAEIEEAEEDEPILFLPFPFTTHAVNEPPYRASDPEWAEYLKINKDRELQHHIKLTLAETLRVALEKNPAYSRVLGGREVQTKKMWLNILYPPRPEPTFYVSGIILDDDGIFWGERPIETLAANRLHRAVYPKAAALATWAFISSLTRQTAQEISHYFGFEKQNETSWENITFEAMKHQQKTQQPTQPTLEDSKNQGAFARAPSSNGSIARRLPPGTRPLGMTDSLENWLGTDPAIDPKILMALLDASNTFAKNWQPVRRGIPRGSIRVDGLIELQGKSAILTADVVGWWDPKQRKFVSIDTGLRNLVATKQRPARG